VAQAAGELQISIISPRGEAAEGEGGGDCNMVSLVSPGLTV